MKKWLKWIGYGVLGLVVIAVAVFGYVRKANDKDIPDKVKTTVLAKNPDGEAIRAAIKGDKGATGVACWDLNGDGLPDVVTEDKNGDKKVDVLDCGKDGEKGEKGEPGAPGEAGKPGANCYDGLTDQNNDGVVDQQDCRGKDGTAVAKIPPVSTVTGASAPKPVKKAPFAVKTAPVVKAPEPEPPPRIQVYQPVSVTINGQEADRPAKESRASSLGGGMTITNCGTMVVSPVDVYVGQ